jgi:hypothetical protein
MAAWSHRLVRDKDGKLHFAFVRFREFESCASGIEPIWNEGKDVDEMQRLARELLSACDRGIIGPDSEDPDYQDEDYRDGSPRLWPIKFPKDGERDNDAWVTARAAARAGITQWVKLVWLRRAYTTRNALPGYAPDPDWSKLPPFNDLVKLSFGELGIIRDTSHPIYRELFGVPGQATGGDGGDDI